MGMTMTMKIFQTVPLVSGMTSVYLAGVKECAKQKCQTERWLQVIPTSRITTSASTAMASVVFVAALLLMAISAAGIPIVKPVVFALAEEAAQESVCGRSMMVSKSSVLTTLLVTMNPRLTATTMSARLVMAAAVSVAQRLPAEAPAKPRTIALRTSAPRPLMATPLCVEV